MYALVCQVLQLYALAIIGVALLSFFRIEPGSGLAQVQSVLRTITDPVLLPLRRALGPAMRGFPLDFSPLIVILVIGLIC